MSGGSFLGALAAGAICDAVGRRKSLMIASVIWIIGAAIQCSSQNVAQLIVGRLISGLAVGITSSQVVSSANAFLPSSKYRSNLSCLVSTDTDILIPVCLSCRTLSGTYSRSSCRYPTMGY